MVIDPSAVAPILFDEPEADHFERLIVADRTRLMSAASVPDRRSSSRRGWAMPEARDSTCCFIVHGSGSSRSTPVSQVEIARYAFRTHGGGRHKAKLNFGGCFAYALSKSSGEPLLFKGGDFGLTDIETCAP